MQWGGQRLKRYQGTCDWYNLSDPAGSWETVALKVILEALKTGGLCPKSGLPMSAAGRAANGAGLGHKVHGDQITVGFVTPQPNDINDYVEELCNMDREIWGFNRMRSNLPGEYCDDWIVQAGSCLAGDGSLKVDPYKDLQIPVPRRAFKDEPRWRMLVAADMGVPVESLDNMNTLNSEIQVNPMTKKIVNFATRSEGVANAGPVAPPAPKPSSTKPTNLSIDTASAGPAAPIIPEPSSHKPTITIDLKAEEAPGQDDKKPFKRYSKRIDSPADSPIEITSSPLVKAESVIDVDDL